MSDLDEQQQSLADSIAGTADEVDTDARKAAIDPAPPPSKELLESDDFDVSVSTSVNHGPELAAQDDPNDEDSKAAKHATAAELHAQANADAAQFLDDTDTMLIQHRNQQEQQQQYRNDARYDDANELELEEPESESDRNIGSESPARRSVLELPPALDLADTGGILSHQEDSLPSPSSSLLAESDPISGETLDSIPDILEDVPLASPTTDAAMFQAAQQQQNAYSQDGYLTREEEAQAAGSGLGISTGPPADQRQSQGQDNPPLQQGQQDPAGGFANGVPPLGPQPSPKQPTFAYHHDDTDTTMAELEEFFSYVEIRGVIEEGRTSWARGWESMGTPEWPEAPIASKKAHIYHLIEELEHRDPEIRFEAARRIAYIAHGTPIYSTSPQHHLHIVITNCTLLRDAGALTAVHEALKSASGRWNIISSIPEADQAFQAGQQSYYPQLTPQERQEYLEEINGELAIHLSVLYFMVEVFRGDEAWADELMALDPPLPIYLLNLVAGLREKNAKGYPVKKLLLLLWKSLLACLGGNKDISRVKKLVRNVEGLPEDKDKGSTIDLKSNPLDFAIYRAEILNKYPTYDPPNLVAPIPQIPMERIVAAAASAPLRGPFHIGPAPTPGPSAFPAANQAPAPGPLPPTPAPSPPPSPQPPKPKKQQYQTDQNRPFVLPFSRTNAGGGHYSSIKGKGKMTVPFSIEEAGRLYKKNIRIPTELWQLWKLREEYLADETGVGKDASASPDPSSAEAGLARQLENMSMEDSFMSIDQRRRSNVAEEPKQDPLSLLYQMESNLKQQKRDMLKAAKTALPEDPQAHKKEIKALTQKIADIKKLQRVELIYRSTLSSLQSTVIVLLKLLLATVTANNNNNMNNGSEDEIRPPLSLEDTDIMRHREITSKAVSAILILTLRWFKTSHAMKFHYLAHLLVDSNCLLLLLKMFGMQEVSNQVRMKNEVEEWNFFHYCHTYASQNPAPSRPEDAMLRAKPSPAPASTTSAGAPASVTDEDEPEVITDFSWRNFFSVINFVHVLQKLTKRKAHRILLLVQYKSSAILKRILKVSHPMLQLYVLKVIKSQVPYCGRKWRQSNMKVITAIYMNCRPDLRDEWLTTIDVDGDLDESLPHEQVLRTLVKFFNTKHYGAFAPQLHRRSSSRLDQSGYGAEPASTQLGHGSSLSNSGSGAPSLSNNRPAGMPPLASPSAGVHNLPAHSPTYFENEAFPPTRPLSMFGNDEHYRTSYIPDSLMDGYLEDYEDLLGDLLTPVYDAQGMPISGALSMSSGPVQSPGGTMHHSAPGMASPSRALGGEGIVSNYMNSAEQAWHRLGEILGETDRISDSESVGSIGYLDVASDSDGSDLSLDDVSQQGRNDWEHLSPDLANALEEDLQRQEEEARSHRSSPNRRRRSASPRSPRIRRSSSGTPRSPALRPVFVNVDSSDDYDDNAVEEDGDDEDGGEDEDDDDGEGSPARPMLRSPRRSPHLSPSKVAIDEVEAFFSE